jgi:Putative Se/S carrier protein-like
MVRDGDLVAIFHSIHRVMKAEKILKQRRLDILLIPVPRQLASDCGLAIRMAPEIRAAVWELLDQEGLLPVELYQRCEGQYTPRELP